MSRDNELLRFIAERLALLDEYSARGRDAFLAVWEYLTEDLPGLRDLVQTELR